MHVKTRRKLNFRKEKHKTDHDHHGVLMLIATPLY